MDWIWGARKRNKLRMILKFQVLIIRWILLSFSETRNNKRRIFACGTGGEYHTLLFPHMLDLRNSETTRLAHLRSHMESHKENWVKTLVPVTWESVGECLKKKEEGTLSGIRHVLNMYLKGWFQCQLYDFNATLYDFSANSAWFVHNLWPMRPNEVH